MNCRFEYDRWPGAYPYVFRVYVRQPPHPNGKSYWSRPASHEQRRRALTEDLRAVLSWCDDQFGKPAKNRWVYVYPGGTIRFRSESDACAFKIRFC